MAVRIDQQRNSKAAKGVRRNGYSRIVVQFEQDQFAEIQSYADAQQISFAGAVRNLCEWGMEAVKETPRAGGD